MKALMIFPSILVLIKLIIMNKLSSYFSLHAFEMFCLHEYIIVFALKYYV